MQTPAEYIANAGQCPECGSESLEGGPFTSEAGQAWQRCTCNDCGFVWSDVFTRAGYSYEIDEGPEAGFYDCLAEAPRVLVTVADGVADVTTTEGLEVRIIDFDVEGEPDEPALPVITDMRCRVEIGTARRFDADAVKMWEAAGEQGEAFCKLCGDFERLGSPVHKYALTGPAPKGGSRAAGPLGAP